MKRIIFIILCINFSAFQLVGQTFRVVNMIPNSLSNETNQDSEPFLTVNPNDPTEIIGSAFTFNPTGATATAPIYISQDGGNTWVLNNIVPSNNGMTGDITVGLSRNNILYSGILRGGMSLQMQIHRSNNYLNPVAMTPLLTRNNIDQPYVENITPLGGGLRNNDLVYVGNNDFNAAAGQTASIEQSLNAATAPAPANFTTVRLETRATAGQDGPPIRTAAHPNGTIYVLFDRITNIAGTSEPYTITSDIILVRDDNWGQGTPAYNNLTDPSDGLAGRIIINGITWTFNSLASPMGQARIGDRMSVAVDPRNSQTVYIAYSDRNPTGGVSSTRVHVLRSTDGGNNWSADLLTLNNAINPQLAVNIHGEVGFLYQQLTGTSPNQTWSTRFRQSGDGGTTWSNTLLHQAPSNTPTATFFPYLGDYAGLKAVGKDFYGIFSGNNRPDNANFPQGVTYQRNADFTTNVLRNQANTADVSVSIDPYFFEVEQIPDDEDYFVRDWTNSTTSFDIGLEPSTQPVFYANSDVWNRRSNTPGSFTALDRPDSEDPHVSTVGHNYAYARVHRKATGSTGTVDLHFLKSEFGTGSNYVDAGTNPDPQLTFSSTDQVQTMTSGYEWDLIATSSSHTCLAVEISNTDDPVVTPTLLGRAPGWPNTDLSVLYDNNKAQRNMGVYPTPSGSIDGPSGSITYFAVVHNAANFSRDITLEFALSKNFRKIFEAPNFVFPIEEGEQAKVSKNKIIIPNVRPGENRWIGLTIPGSRLKKDQKASIHISELVDNIPVNGFSFELSKGSVKQVLDGNYHLYVETFYRTAKLFDEAWASAVSEEGFDQLIRAKANTSIYVDYLSSHFEAYEKLIGMPALEKYFENDIFNIVEAVKGLGEALEARENRVEEVMLAHAVLNHRVDAMLTYVDKQRGDVADILQNFRWQANILSSSRISSRSEEVKQLLKNGKEFQKAFLERKLTDDDYAIFISENFDFYVAIAELVKNRFGIDLEKELNFLQSQRRDPQRLQKAHYDFLLKIYRQT